MRHGTSAYPPTAGSKSHAPFPTRADRLPDRGDGGDALPPGRGPRIVGVSGYAVRPKRVRRGEARVSAFTSADIPKILALEPDLVLTFSDLQAEIAQALLRGASPSLASTSATSQASSR